MNTFFKCKRDYEVRFPFCLPCEGFVLIDYYQHLSIILQLIRRGRDGKILSVVKSAGLIYIGTDFKCSKCQAKMTPMDDGEPMPPTRMELKEASKLFGDDDDTLH